MSIRFLLIRALLPAIVLTLPGHSITLSAQSIGAGVFAYPSADQSQQQQQKDQFECHNWASGQTGYNPMNAPQPGSQAYAQSSYSSSSSGVFGGGETGEGGVIRDGARGAAGGAMIGAIAGDAGKGAAIGAATGALFGGMKRRARKREQQQWEEQQRQQAQQQQQAMQQQHQQQMNNYRNAYRVCLSARDYQVQ